jgi:hypothetical protein
MSTPASSDPTPDEEPPERHRRISAYSSRPDRTVFTESGNPDGWIATDATVDVEP